MSEPDKAVAEHWWWRVIDRPFAKLLIRALYPIRRFLSFSSVFVRRTYFYSRLKTKVSDPVYGTAVSLLGFLAATVGSIKSSEIKDAFPFCCFAGFGSFPVSPLLWTWSKDAMVYGFWATAFSWLYLFMVQEDQKGESIASLQAESAAIATEAKLIREAVLTLPPVSFVQQFSQQITNVRSVLLSTDAWDTTISEEELKKTLHVLLGIVVGLGGVKSFV